MPLITDGLLAQYPCTDGTGTTLTDVSGNGKDGTITSPVWTAQGLACPTGGVHLPLDLYATAKTIQIFCHVAPSSANPAQGSTLLTIDNTWSGGLSLRQGTGQVYYDVASQPVFYAGTATSNAVRGDNGITLTFSDKVRVYFNDTEAVYLSQEGAVTPPTPSSALRLAEPPGGGGSQFQDKYYYILFYSTTLTAEQIAQNYAFMRGELSKRSVTLGDTTPDQPDFLFIGDSLTASFFASPAGEYPTVVMGSRSGSYNWYNVGEGGDDAATALTQAPRSVYPMLARNPGRQKVCIVWLGTNGIAQQGRSGAQAYADLVAYCQGLRSADPTVKIVVLTMISRGGLIELPAPVESFETDRLIFNDLVRTNYATFADAVADVGADATLGQSDSYLNGVYFVNDFTHLLNPGYAIVGGYVGGAMDGLGLT